MLSPAWDRVWASSILDVGTATTRRGGGPLDDLIPPLIDAVLAEMACARRFAVLAFPAGRGLDWAAWGVYPERDAPDPSEVLPWGTRHDDDWVRRATVARDAIALRLEESGLTVECMQFGHTPWLLVHDQIADLVTAQRRIQP